MLVNGKQFKDDEIFKALLELPTSFPELQKIAELQKLPREQEANDHAKQGVIYFNQGKYELARVEFEKSRNIDEKTNNLVGLCEDYRNIGNCYFKEQNWDKAEDAYNRLAEINKRLNNYINLIQDYKDIVFLHKTKGDLAEYEQNIRSKLKQAQDSNDQEALVDCHLALGAIELEHGHKKESRKHYFQVYELHQGKIEKDAVWVEQHEVAFSDSAPLATNNIQQCVLLVLYPKDKSSNKTLFAHIDISTDLKSLEKLIKERMPKGPFEARLVGAREREPNSISNMTKTVDFLKHLDVDIVSADFEYKPHPMAVVFDPKTRQLKQGIAAEVHPDRLLRDGKINIAYSYNKPLELVFDLTESKTGAPDRAPIKLDKGHIDQLKSYKGLGEEKVAVEQSKRTPGQPPTWDAKFAEGTIALTKAHEKETEDLFAKVTQELRVRGQDVNKEKLKKVLRESPKYIGEKASGANEPIIETLLNQSLYTKTVLQEWYPENWRNSLRKQVTGQVHLSIKKETPDLIDKALTVAHYTPQEFVEALTSRHIATTSKGWYKDKATSGEDEGKDVLRIEVETSKQGLAIRNELKSAGLQSVKARVTSEEDEKGETKKVHSVRVNIEEIERLSLQQRQNIIQKMAAANQQNKGQGKV